MRSDALKKVRNRMAKELPAGQTPSLLIAPEVPLEMVAVQPAEKAARETYRQLIDAAPDLPVANDARIELAEMLAARGDNDSAIDLLLDTLERSPVRRPKKK